LYGEKIRRPRDMWGHVASVYPGTGPTSMVEYFRFVFHKLTNKIVTLGFCLNWKMSRAKDSERASRCFYRELLLLSFFGETSARFLHSDSQPRPTSTELRLTNSDTSAIILFLIYVSYLKI
jgi:hypothetical protein